MSHPIFVMNLQYYISSKVKKYNLNVTEVRDPTLKNKFSRNFQFHRRDPIANDINLRIMLSRQTIQTIFGFIHVEAKKSMCIYILDIEPLDSKIS